MKRIFEDIHKYDDIIDLPHYQSACRPSMPIAERAAQFAPFAALVGYGELVKDTAEMHLKHAEEIKRDPFEEDAL